MRPILIDTNAYVFMHRLMGNIHTTFSYFTSELMWVFEEVHRNSLDRS
jgi:hypothetical protein